MTFKTWIWTFGIVTAVGWSAFFYVNAVYYANVMDLGFFIPVLAVQLYIGMYVIIRKKQAFLYAGFLMMIAAIIYFVVTVPAYTYKEAQQSVMETYQTEIVEPLSLGRKTVPADHSSWFMPDKMYYVAVVAKKNEGQTDYYAVDTAQGRILKLNEPY